MRLRCAAPAQRSSSNIYTACPSTQFNWHLFGGFLLITVVLLLTPGPIVTLVISTAATKGVRAGLVTVAGTSTGNAALLLAIALGLSCR